VRLEIRKSLIRFYSLLFAGEFFNRYISQITLDSGFMAVGVASSLPAACARSDGWVLLKDIKDRKDLVCGGRLLRQPLGRRSQQGDCVTILKIDNSSCYMADSVDDRRDDFQSHKIFTFSVICVNLAIENDGQL